VERKRTLLGRGKGAFNEAIWEENQIVRTGADCGLHLSGRVGKKKGEGLKSRGGKIPLPQRGESGIREHTPFIKENLENPKGRK